MHKNSYNDITHVDRQKKQMDENNIDPLYGLDSLVERASKLATDVHSLLESHSDRAFVGANSLYCNETTYYKAMTALNRVQEDVIEVQKSIVHLYPHISSKIPEETQDVLREVEDVSLLITTHLRNLLLSIRSK